MAAYAVHLGGHLRGFWTPGRDEPVPVVVVVVVVRGAFGYHERYLRRKKTMLDALLFNTGLGNGMLGGSAGIAIDSEEHIRIRRSLGILLFPIVQQVKVRAQSPASSVPRQGWRRWGEGVM